MFRPGTGLPFAAVAPMHRQDFHRLPRQTQTGASELQRGNIGQHHATARRQSRQQIGSNAMTQRIAGRQHHDPLPCRLRRANPCRHLRKRPGQIAAFGLR